MTVHGAEKGSLKETHQALLSAIRRPADASLILVFGPTGVGKTTPRLRVEKQLIEEALPDLQRDPESIPVASRVRAVQLEGLLHSRADRP